jgi:hypothetical protein
MEKVFSLQSSVISRRKTKKVFNYRKSPQSFVFSKRQKKLCAKVWVMFEYFWNEEGCDFKKKG